MLRNNFDVWISGPAVQIHAKRRYDKNLGGPGTTYISRPVEVFVR